MVLHSGTIFAFSEARSKREFTGFPAGIGSGTLAKLLPFTARLSMLPCAEMMAMSRFPSGATELERTDSALAARLRPVLEEVALMGLGCLVQHLTDRV